MALCQVALGTCNKIKGFDHNADDFVKKNYKNYQSTHGMGMTVPNEK